MTFTSIGEVTIGPDDDEVVVGEFEMGENDDTIWFEVQRTSPDQGWPWSYGILTWKTEFGLELGSVKAYTATEGEIYKLGVGLAPRTRTGDVIYKPRSYNMAWIKKDYDLTLSFAAQSGITVPALVESVASVSFVVQGGSWVYDRDSGLVELDI